MAIAASSTIHPSAVISDSAEIGPDCFVGPFCVVGDKVTLAANVTLKSHVVIEGETSVGEGTTIWPFASIGHQPQDLKFGGEQSRLIIGARNMIRESVTMNPGTVGGGLETRIGDDNLFMVNVHVGHDCQVGNNNVFANNVSLAGHVVVEDNVVVGGHTGIHQYCRIGRGAMIGILSIIVADVIPYGTATGEAAALAGLNLVGLKRRQTEKATMHELRSAYKELFSGGGTLKERAVETRAAYPDNELIQNVVDFVLSDSDRSFCQPRS